MEGRGSVYAKRTSEERRRWIQPVGRIHEFRAQERKMTKDGDEAVGVVVDEAADD